MKKAFTLIEVMVVLTLIGILTAILMPIAFHSAPDENVMKFKKANTTFGTVISELVSSDRYFQNGDLGVKIGGANAEAPFLCNAMADVMTVKSLSCSTTCVVADGSNLDASNLSTLKTTVDTKCANSSLTSAEIITPDGVGFAQTCASSSFATPALRTVENGFIKYYKIFCIDVDGFGTGEAPFGYAVRLDGKIITGARADEWLQKSVQRGG